MARNLAASYQKVQTGTASPAQRVVLVYKGIVKNLENAYLAFDSNDPSRFEKINNGIILATQLITELQVALDKSVGGDIAVNLERLYIFWRHQLSDANVKKDKVLLGEILVMVKDLTESWVEAERKLRTGGPEQS